MVEFIIVLLSILCGVIVIVVSIVGVLVHKRRDGWFVGKLLLFCTFGGSESVEAKEGCFWCRFFELMALWDR